MERTLRTLAVLFLLAGLPGCSCRDTDPRLRSAESEIQALQARIEALETLPPQPDRLIQPPEPEPEEAEQPDAAARDPLGERIATMRHQVKRTGSLLGEVDEDLAALEDHVDSHMARIDALSDTVDELSTVVNNHADSIDALATELDDLYEDMAWVREMQSVMNLEDGKVVIRETDLLMVQGRNTDGRPAENGYVLRELAPEFTP